MLANSQESTERRPTPTTTFYPRGRPFLRPRAWASSPTPTQSRGLPSFGTWGALN